MSEGVMKRARERKTQRGKGKGWGDLCWLPGLLTPRQSVIFPTLFSSLFKDSPLESHSIPHQIHPELHPNIQIQRYDIASAKRTEMMAIDTHIRSENQDLTQDKCTSNLGFVARSAVPTALFRTKALLKSVKYSEFSHGRHKPESIVWHPISRQAHNRFTISSRHGVLRQK